MSNSPGTLEDLTEPISPHRKHGSHPRSSLRMSWEEQGFDALTIGALTERAMVSRAAFYRNYQDKYDLVELIKERGSLGLPHSPMMSVHAAHLAHPAHSTHPFSDTFVPDLVAALFVEAITWWLEQGQPYPPRELATKTALLAAAVFREASTWS